MDKKILSLVILITMVVILTLGLISWQIGFAVKENAGDEKDTKGNLRLISQTNNLDNENVATAGKIILNPIDESINNGGGGSRRSGGGSSSSDESTNTGGNTNPNPTPEPEKPSVEIFISPAASNHAKGNEFIIEVNISTLEKIYAVEFSLNFNPKILEIIEVGEGGFLKQDDASTSLKICEQGFKELCPIINNTSGLVKVSNTRLGATTGVSGQGSLVEIKFKAKNSGSSDLILDEIKIADTSLEIDKFNIEKNNGEVIIV